MRVWTQLTSAEQDTAVQSIIAGMVVDAELLANAQASTVIQNIARRRARTYYYIDPGDVTIMLPQTAPPPPPP